MHILGLPMIMAERAHKEQRGCKWPLPGEPAGDGAGKPSRPAFRTAGHCDSFPSIWPNCCELSPHGQCVAPVPLDTAANKSELRNPVDVHAKLKLVILFF